MPQINATVLISHPSSIRDTCFGWRACVKLRDKGMPVVPTSHPNLSTHNMLAAPQDILLSLRRMLASPSRHKHALFLLCERAHAESCACASGQLRSTFFGCFLQMRRTVQREVWKHSLTWREGVPSLRGASLLLRPRRRCVPLESGLLFHNSCVCRPCPCRRFGTWH